MNNPERGQTLGSSRKLQIQVKKKQKMPHPKNSKLHAAMFPWLGMSHMTQYLHLANELAKRGHKVSYLVPRKPKLQIESKNHYPELISFHLVSVPHVAGLPPGTETASEIPPSSTSLLGLAFDDMHDKVGALLRELKPDLVVFDAAFWITDLAPVIGFKTVCYNVVCAAFVAFAFVPAGKLPKGRPLTEEEATEPPVGYPSSSVVLRRHEARALSFISLDFGGMTIYDRVVAALRGCDAIGIRTCTELEGPFCDYLASQFQKPMLLSGPIFPETDKIPLEDLWAEWLGRFEPGTVVFCAFGREVILEKNQFQELVLGFELTGLPFLIALKPPLGTSSVEEALPEGFAERVRGRGVVHGGWVQQPQILRHPSVGCFVHHCGFGTMWESLMSDCQIVLVPQHLGDQILTTMLLCEELKVAVEVERGENGWFSKESLSNAIKSATDHDSKVGSLIKKNHAHWKDTLVNPEFLSNYVEDFIAHLYEL